ncbi:hypothetical protein LTS02_007193 [Friedmanniomyces endolithicus]|nr:hypothetical protein LTS02_007193 [Friedmanniomyces endolithicus]
MAATASKLLTSLHHLLRSGDDELNNRRHHHITACTILTPSGNDHHSFAGLRAMTQPSAAEEQDLSRALDTDTTADREANGTRDTSKA